MKLVIPGVPIPKARHEVCRIGKHLRMYDPQDHIKKAISLIIKSLKESSYDYANYSAFSMSLLFYFPYKKDRFLWIEPLHTDKPDSTNLYKFYEDCANEILYQDDKQIVEIYAKKLYSDQPRTEIEITPMERPELDAKVMKVMRIFDPETLKSIAFDAHSLNLISKKLEIGQEQPHYSDLLTVAASLLVSFSVKYKDLLSKIVKVGDIPCDTSLLESLVGG